MPRSLRLAVFVVPALLAVAAAAWWLWPGRAGSEGLPATVEVVIGAIEDTMSAVGALQPPGHVDAGARVSG